MGGFSTITSTAGSPQIGAPTATPGGPGVAAPWFPPQWIGGGTHDGSTAFFSTFAAPALTLTATDPQSGNQTAYVFDAVIRGEHESDGVVTLNPQQNGPAVTDNFYVLPSRFTADIAMSDAMQSFNIGQWSGGPSRSVNAFQTLKAIQLTGLPVSVATRLQQYDNMMIVGIRANESKDTKYGLTCTVTFQNIITAAIGTPNPGGQPASAIPQSTLSTNTGPVQTQPVPASIVAQNQVAATTTANTFAGSPTISVASTTGILPGQPVSGPGIAPGTVVG